MRRLVLGAVALLGLSVLASAGAAARYEAERVPARWRADRWELSEAGERAWEALRARCGDPGPRAWISFAHGDLQPALVDGPPDITACFAREVAPHHGRDRMAADPG
jgi:hypothetical protein